MSQKNRSFSIKRATRALQDNVGRSSAAAGAAYTLVGAILVLGAIGYAADQWRGTSPWLLLTGLLMGIVVGFYELVKTTWPR